MVISSVGLPDMFIALKDDISDDQTSCPLDGVGVSTRDCYAWDNPSQYGGSHRNQLRCLCVLFALFLLGVWSAFRTAALATAALLRLNASRRPRLTDSKGFVLFFVFAYLCVCV